MTEFSFKEVSLHREDTAEIRVSGFSRTAGRKKGDLLVYSAGASPDVLTIHDGSPDSPSVATFSPLPAVFVLPSISFDKRVFISLAKREAVVLAISPDEFTARLTNLTDGGPDNFGDLEGIFPIDEVSRADLPLLKPGAIFYWNIGYYDDPAGQRHRVSDLRFRRLPAWHPGELASADRKADTILEELGLT